MQDTEKRIEDLEIRVSYQENTIQELNGQLYGQRQAIDRLEATVRSMAKRLRDLHPGNADLPVNERPPHY